MERATEKKEVMKRMNEQEKKEITEMTEAAKYLVKNIEIKTEPRTEGE